MTITKKNLIVTIVVASLVVAIAFLGIQAIRPTQEVQDPPAIPAEEIPAEEIPAEEIPAEEQKVDTLFEETFRFSFMSNIWEPHPIEGNPIFDELMKRTNTEIEFHWFPAAGYPERVTATLASGILPDMIAGAGIPILIDQGAIIPLDDLLEKHGQNILNHVSEDMVRVRQIRDGKIYHLPMMFGLRNAFAMQIRKDWLENVGIDEIPETWDEWKTVWRAFRDQDANEDGDPTNEVPFAGDVFGLMPAFGINIGARTGFVVDDEGNYTLMYELPEFRLALEELRALYEEGLLDKEFATRGTWVDNLALERATHANLTGSMMTWAANTRTTSELLREINPRATLIGVPPIQGPQGRRGIAARVRTVGASAITIAAEDKAENIIKFFNYVFSEEGIRLMSYGIEGIHHEIVDDRPIIKLPYAEDFTSFRSAGLNFTPFPHVFLTDAFMQVTLGGKPFEEITETMRLFYDALHVGEDYFFDVVPVLSTRAFVEYQAGIFPVLEGLLARCIIGEISIDEFFYEYEKLKAVGLQEILDEGREAWQLLTR